MKCNYTKLIQRFSISDISQGGHKPGILWDFYEHGKLREFCATSGKNCNSILVRYSNHHHHHVSSSYVEG